MSAKASELLDVNAEEPPVLLIIGIICAAISAGAAKRHIESWQERTSVGRLFWAFESVIILPLALIGALIGLAGVLIGVVFILPGIALEYATSWYRDVAYKTNNDDA